MGQPDPREVDRYDVGDLVRVVASFVGTDGLSPANPSYVQVQVMNPLGSVATAAFGGGSVVQVGSAAYAHDFTITHPGSWFYRWVGTGRVQAAEVWSLVGEASVFNL